MTKRTQSMGVNNIRTALVCKFFMEHKGEWVTVKQIYHMLYKHDADCTDKTLRVCITEVSKVFGIREKTAKCFNEKEYCYDGG